MVQFAASIRRDSNPIVGRDEENVLQTVQTGKMIIYQGYTYTPQNYFAAACGIPAIGSNIYIYNVNFAKKYDRYLLL